MAHEIVPVSLVVKAMQDSGYKNAAYALAELIDNSIQAEASQIELICLEHETFLTQRRVSRLTQLAVIDNGCGMDPSELRRALQFGNGGHLNDRDGIGRFGMGLPNSSMSQGERVDVWTWQRGPDDAIYSYLDLGEIIEGILVEVPEPVKKPIPKQWKKTCKSFGETGTLVCWSKPTRCTWKTAKSVVRNTEEIVGRLYRRFLNDGRAQIRMVSFDESDLGTPTLDISARPNDPGYLMAVTSCPEPFSKFSMFEPWGDHFKQPISIHYNDKVHDVILTYSLAKAEARQGHNPGATPHGKHAARNLGVSVIRADRELELDPKWMPTYDPVARWIGIEVDFPPALDEVFGVTNNKQSATHLAELAGFDKKELAERHGFSSYQELKDAWADEGDARVPLLTVKDAIETTRGALMQLLSAQTRGSRRETRHVKDTPESKATEATRERQDKGFVGKSDEGENLEKEVRQSQVEKGLVEAGVSENLAKELAATTISSGLKYVFGHASTTSGAFFNVKPKGGAILITLNTDHPAYEHLVALLEDSQEEEQTIDKLRRQHQQAFDGLKLLLIAWARFEDEAKDGPEKIALQEAREDWGRVARRFLAED